MFSFTKEQKVLDIKGVRVGGQPGVNPTLIITGFFFKSKPDRGLAERYIPGLISLSGKLGNPVIPDFFIKREEYVDDVVEIIKEILPGDHPFSVDIVDPAVKVKTLERLHEEDMLSRTIYNSIHVGVTSKEQEALEEYKPEAAIVLCFNPKDNSVDGRIEVLENSAHLNDKGLLDLAKEVGVDKLLLDTAAMSPGENSGAALAAIPVLKEEYGYPVGCAIHNVVEKSTWLKNYDDVYRVVDASSNSAVPLFGGDYVISGPVEYYNTVIPLVAWFDILVSEYTEGYFGVEPSVNHPRRRLLR
jgi:tetrahydromethanopterin S-methyltransferase subunit H